MSYTSFVRFAYGKCRFEVGVLKSTSVTGLDVTKTVHVLCDFSMFHFECPVYRVFLKCHDR